MEYGIKVKEADYGDVVATRRSNEPDELGARRYIQVVDTASRTMAMDKVRGLTAAISSNDALTLDALPAELEANMIEAGDKSVLGVLPVHTQDDGSVDITPVVTVIENGSAEIERVWDTVGRLEYACVHPDGTLDGGAWTEYTTTAGWIGEYTDASQEVWTELLRFQLVDAPPEADVASATIDLHLTDSYGTGHASNIYVYAFTETQIASLVAANETAEERGLALMDLASGQTGVAWDLSGEADNAWATSPDIGPAIQSAIARSEWVRDQALWIYFQPEPLFSLTGITEFTLTNTPSWYPKLTITHDGGVQTKAVLETKRSAVGTNGKFVDADGAYRSPLLSWDLLGAFKVGLHITGLSTSNAVILYGGVI